MNFLCDSMLGTLAKWLRVYGFNTFYANNELEDEDLIEIAKKENRALVTRDIELAQKAKRENLKVIEVTSTDVDNQIKQILNDIDVIKKNILTRCLLCNSKLQTIAKKDVKNKVPEGAFKLNDKFWICKKCNKIYWKGTHYDNMIKKIKL
jgi:hypothetical protein